MARIDYVEGDLIVCIRQFEGDELCPGAPLPEIGKVYKCVAIEQAPWFIGQMLGIDFGTVMEEFPGWIYDSDFFRKALFDRDQASDISFQELLRTAKPKVLEPA